MACSCARIDGLMVVRLIAISSEHSQSGNKKINVLKSKHMVGGKMFHQHDFKLFSYLYPENQFCQFKHIVSYSDIQKLILLENYGFKKKSN